MLLRIVKMTFRHEEIANFIELFKARKHQIRATAGCLHVELLQDQLHQNIFFTWSHWANAEALENYRNSAFFAETWQLTKYFFAVSAEAWSVSKVSTTI